MHIANNGFRLSLVAIVVISHASFSQISKNTFENVNSIIFNSHLPIITSTLNSHLTIVELWQNFGGAFRIDSTHKPPRQAEFVVTLTGNVPQNQHINSFGYAIVACHEIGHILGGAPHQTKSLSKWSSVEGQADYFATSDCMWRYMHDANAMVSINDFEAGAVNLCHEKYTGDSANILDCLKIISGIISIQKYFNDTSSKDNPVDYRLKDSSQVEVTLEKYPSNQCRIDTMMAGVLKQPRPTCWFAS